ncbi:MAG: N-succinylarginine dihydrolase [Pseudomonadota bacterium]
MTKTWEVNFDGIVGPTHHYAGLAYGNLAAMRNQGERSNPREAALKGLLKMKMLMDLGLKQAVMPPQERPCLPVLRDLGFRGTDEEVLEKAAREAPGILAAVSSASSMWTANAATISPGADTLDGKVHITPANLTTHFHRAIEAGPTGRILKKIFHDEKRFTHHAPLPAGGALSDEGSANQLRLSGSHGTPGVELFVYGRRATGSADRAPALFPARQTREASEAIARLHRLDPERTLFLRQNPALIDEGVFHNDVIGTANENVLFFHGLAFAEGAPAMEELRRRFQAGCGGVPVLIEVGEGALSPREAVDTYLFNSQIITLPEGGMALVSPMECRENEKTRAVIERILSEDFNPIHRVHYVSLRQSMRNGGGPACLRLRVVLSEEELAGIHQGVLLTPGLVETLEEWVGRGYRDQLDPGDLGDRLFLDETRAALDELTRILGLGSIYSFQN